MTCERCSISPKRDPSLLYCAPCAEAILRADELRLREMHKLGRWAMTPIEQDTCGSHGARNDL